MSRWIVVLLLVAGPAAAQEFTVERAAIVRALFQDTTEQPAEEADPDSQAAAPVREAVISAQWRGLNLEAWGGIIGSKHSMWSLGLGLSFSVTDNIALAFRAEYNQELGAARDYRPQLRTAIFEPGVRFHLDFHDRIALYTNHGLSVAAQYAFYKVDGRVR